MNRSTLFIRSLRPLFSQKPLSHRAFSIEPRSLQFSRHASHRALYRWTLQAFGVPFLVAYLCEKIADNSEGGGKSELPMYSGMGFNLGNLPWPGDMGMGLKFKEKMREMVKLDSQWDEAVDEVLEIMGPGRIRDAVANLGVY